jgi:predicted SnoaL-like aldol condensation-catalyzing enzyme
MTKKEKVIALLNSFETGESIPLTYINQNKYIQHNLSAADGINGLIELISYLPKGATKVKVIRAFQDGDYIFTHTEYDFFGPKAGFDVFRFEDCLIVEHWDNLQEIAPPNPSGHTQLDGSVNLKDFEKTDRNKTLIKDFYDEVLMPGNYNDFHKYLNDGHYIEHNPMLEDNISAMINAAKAMKEAGIPMQITKLHLLLGEGNFVLVTSEGNFMGKPTSFADLFRLEDGKIAEHWDTLEEIPSREVWKNENGKF